MVEDRHALQQLSKSLGWVRLVKQFKEECEDRQRAVNMVNSSMGDVLEKEFAKGEMAAISAMTGFPEAEIAFLTEQIEELDEQIARREKAEEDGIDLDSFQSDEDKCP